MFDSGIDEPWLEGLNEEQRRAATSPAPSLLVVAGAGTGKTRTLAARVAHLVARGAPSERILLLTFTRRAARTMIDRAERLTRDPASGRVWAGTFHSIGNRLLRAHGRSVGLGSDFTVLDAADAADLVGMVRSELRAGESGRRFPRKETLASIYSRTVNARTALTEVLERWYPWCVDNAGGIRDIFRGYVERKTRHNVLDYDDLLLYWDALARTGAGGRALRDMFDHILVDEYQDTNRLQAEILMRMRSPANSIMVVGDDAQAIYSFRSATVTNILDFADDHEGTETVKLERNYRSTEPILRASNAVIAQARRRHVKELWCTLTGGERPTLVTCADERSECDEVCARVLSHREAGVALERQAVLFRAGHHSAALELELARRNIPFVKYGGLRFLESAHVKDLVAYLRILENPHDELAWFRVVQLLEGVGAATARRVLAHVGVGDPSVESPLARLISAPPSVPESARADLEALRGCVADAAAADPHPSAAIDGARAFFEPVIARVYDAVSSRLSDLDQLAAIAAGYPTRARFLAELTLDPPTSTADLAGRPTLDEDHLNLSTIHSAKGCEWEVVHVIHAADGMIPSDMALTDEDGLDEELRLFYVALTRARRALHVYFPLRLYLRPHGSDDGHGLAQLTRFLPSSVQECFERTSAGSAADDDAASPAQGASTVQAFLEELWA
ncbi:MAG TPA: ATP-dependent helicase [Actinomycetota bacterium]|nr:ATP-dependent helicase [Actinomycetota bacterium]